MITDFKLIPIDIINKNSLILESSYLKTISIWTNIESLWTKEDILEFIGVILNLQNIFNYIFTFLICEKYQEIYAQLKFLKYNS